VPSLWKVGSKQGGGGSTLVTVLFTIAICVAVYFLLFDRDIGLLRGIREGIGKAFTYRKRQKEIAEAISKLERILEEREDAVWLQANGIAVPCGWSV
jgi:hypothetical protein